MKTPWAAWRPVAILVGAALGLWSPGDTYRAPILQAQTPTVKSPLAPCRVRGVDEMLRCGKLTVFENRRSRAGRTIDLNVVVLPSLDPTSREAPLFDLAGGPGAGATSGARDFSTDLKAYRARRDVVLLDQRGTGESNPLHCRHDTSPQYFLDEMYPVEYVSACRQELEQKADLTQYTTPIAAADLDDVRAWLGYERINLIGTSYGTRAALVYIRQYPDRVRSAVLLGVSPPGHKLPLHHASDGQRALSLVLEECAADERCRRAAPRAGQDLRELLARLDRQPARVKHSLRGSGEVVTVEIRGDVFAERLRSMLYQPAGARRIPFLITRAARGDFAPFLDIVIPANRTRPDSIADGMYLSLTCAEDTTWIDPAEAARLNKDTVFGNYRVIQQRRACGMWPRGALPDDYHQPVTSAAAVLVISGRMDPVTPPAWGDRVVQHLPNGRHVVIHHLAHGPEGLSGIECYDKLITDFIGQGHVRGLSTSCVDQMRPPPFVVEPPR